MITRNNGKMDNNNNYGSAYAPSMYNNSFQSQPYGSNAGMDVASTNYSTPSSQPIDSIPFVPVEPSLYSSYNTNYL